MARQQALKETIEKRKRARELAVPTNDNAVKLKLREFDEPIVIFGEGAPERRERLRDIMAQNLDLDEPYEAARGGELAVKSRARTQHGRIEEVEEKQSEVFYTEGSEALMEARKWVVKDSLERAQRRVEAERARVEEECADVAAYEASHAQLAGVAYPPLLLLVDRLRPRSCCLVRVRCRADDLAWRRLPLRPAATKSSTWPAAALTAPPPPARPCAGKLRGVTNMLSNFGDERPISFVCFAPRSKVVATGSWSNLVKLWSVPDCACLATLKGHTERISGLAWHPESGAALSPTSVNLVSASCDSTAKLWPLEGGKALGELTGHAGRLSRVAFHPSGRFVGTASFDTTWRLWDVATCKELLLQEGHTRALYAIAFHPDGSLVATAGLDAIVRLWDVRSGRAIQTFQGHVKQVRPPPTPGEPHYPTWVSSTRCGHVRACV